ncbi:MAG: hypothetical protein ACR2RF_06070 [Geminicoccaceae bacterium]
MTDLEKALAKIEEGAGELRPFDKIAAHEIEQIVIEVRKDSITEELDGARGRAA